MKIYNFSDMKMGWFVGDFEPSVLRTDAFEVAFHTHPKGHYHASHFHKVATEINLLVRGKMRVGDTIVEAGQIFVFDPNDVSDVDFLEDCELVVVKTPSVIGDKYETGK